MDNPKAWVTGPYVVDLVETWNPPIKSSSHVPEAVTLYRKVLCAPVCPQEGRLEVTKRHSHTQAMPLRAPATARLRLSDHSGGTPRPRGRVEQRDHSVVIAAIGFTTNIAALLRSPPDEISPLSGTELVSKKVRQVIWQGGLYDRWEGDSER
eukprot:3951543-Prymnesium_polylepis.1